MSKIYVVNPNDEIIGVKDWGTLGPNDSHRISVLWLTNSKNEALIAQRAFSKKIAPGKWGAAAAGTVEEGETYKSNIIKEAEEEIGLKDFKFRKGPKILIEEGPPRFCQFYSAKVDKTIDEFIIQKEEVEQIKWIPIDELREDLRKNPQLYAPSAKRGLEIFHKDK